MQPDLAEAGERGRALHAAASAQRQWHRQREKEAAWSAGVGASDFCIIIGASAGTRKHAAWEELMRAASGAFGRAHWRLVLQKHGYLAGHAHIEKAADRRRMSSCDTSVVVLATDAAARRWPAGPSAESTFRAACELALPRRLKRPSHAMKARSRAKRARSRGSVHSS